MSLRIQNNIEAFNAHRQLVQTGSALSKSMEKLSSGYRINRAADDSAGLAISEKLRAEIGGLDQAQRNSQDAVSLVQTAEGAMSEVHAMLQRVRELAVQYNNGTLSASDKASITAEVSQLCAEISRIGNDTKFNNIAVLTGSSAITFQVGADDGQTISVSAVALFGSGSTFKVDSTIFNFGTTVTLASHRRRHPGRQRCPLDLRLGAEPPRAQPQQPGHLPGEPDRVREPHPRRGHGLRDGHLHQAADPAAGRHPMLAQANQAPQGVLSLLR